MYPVLNKRRKGQSNVVLVWVAFVLFAQGLVPIQAHTNWILANGQLITVCSWHGGHDINPASGGDVPNQFGGQRTPAIVFSELLISVIMPVIPTMPGALFHPAPWPVERTRSPVLSRRPYRLTIRAPPWKLRL